MSFHYMSAEQMYDMEYYVYHLRPYGVRFGSPDRNARQMNYSQSDKLAGSRSRATRQIVVGKV